MKFIVTMKKIQEVFDQILVPGMDDGWYYAEQEQEISYHNIMAICEEYHKCGLFANDDELTNTIRFGVCRFLGDAMQVWDPEPDTPQEVMELWQECRTPGDSADIPWQIFNKALSWLLYHAPESLQGICDDILAEDNMYFAVEVRISCDENERAYIRIGANWSDIWAIDYEVQCDVTEEEFIQQVNQHLPYYMQVNV